MKKIRRLLPLIFILLIALVATGLLITSCSPSAEKLNNEGNSKFAEEAYMESLAAYQNAVIESPELAEPYYNAANALYREGAFAEALALMQQALSFAEDESLAESGFYNMGNSSFNSEEWESAVAAYSDALLLNPDDPDAKYNLELALQQMEQQQQEEEQEQEQEENEEEQEQNEEEQEQNGEGEENDQEQEGDQSQDDQNQDEESDQEQEQDKSQNGEGEEDDSQQEQQEQNGEGQPQDGEPEGEPQPGQLPPPGQRMTEEQARQLLAAIAGDSDTLQERLGQIFVAPPIPPVQDW